eukprot:TRINITY_DN46743_c0_g1_i1.p1 TRINITY_DN46743_c0_g1~~TRINITY_DN46743_c0_g1_i1.p1  ORF type:complete len:493 (+),score=78.28 TRINITY_DN46743_c0_g1_i1:62-1540(+)
MTVASAMALPDGFLRFLQGLVDHRVVQSCTQYFSGRGCIALVAAALSGRFLWYQYGVLLNHNLPTHHLECPFVGSTLGMFWYGYANWARLIRKQYSVLFTNFCGVNSALISWPVYEAHVKKADNGGQLDQGQFPQYMVDLIGDKSILFLKAGKGQEKHHRLRNKVLASMSPKRVLALVPDMVKVIRDIFDKMESETQERGFSLFQDYVWEIPQRITALPIAGGMSTDLADRFGKLIEQWLNGMVSFPVNLGQFSTYGRALKARQEVGDIIRKLLHDSDGSGGCVISDLAKSSDDGAGLTQEEIVDTIFTLIFAGQLTTSETLPPLLVELAKRPEWGAKIAAEPLLEFTQIEGDSATVRFVREVLRHYPPESFFFRQNKTCPMSLGEHGQVPAGCNLAINFGGEMWKMGEDFNPDRWTHDVSHDLFLNFGGSSPHSCVGRSIAMVELQLFARVLAQEYDVEVLDATQVRNWQLGGITFMYKGGCKVKISKKRP